MPNRGNPQRGGSTPQRGRGYHHRSSPYGHHNPPHESHHLDNAHRSRYQPQKPQQRSNPSPRFPSGNPTGEFSSEMGINSLTELIHRLRQDMSMICDENAELKGDMILMKTELNAQRAKIVDLEQEVDDLQQYGRRENVCFSNLKFSDTQPVMKQVINLCEEIDVTVTEEDFVDVHPLPSKRGHAKRVVARFKDRKLGQKVMGARKSAKNIAPDKKKELAADPTRGFGIQPNITSKRAVLLKQAKAAVEKARLNGTWIDIKTGAVLIRTKPGERPRVIRNSNDILKIVPNLQITEFVFCVDDSKKFDVFDTSFYGNDCNDG